jgi:hypothetical protein
MWLDPLRQRRRSRPGDKDDNNDVGKFEQEQVEQCRSSICRVRSATNLYLIGVIQEVERQNSETGVGSLRQ